MKVPLMDLARQRQALGAAMDDAVERVLDSGQYILGPEVKAFEQEVAGSIGIGHAIGVASGTDALFLALRAAGVQQGDAVVTSPFTFFATASAIVNAGASPVFADIDPHTFNMDPDALARLLGRQASRGNPVKAVIPVHLYGQTADMAPIMELSEQHGLTIIEDAAQAIGATYRGQQAGTMGHMGCFSFFPTKNLGAYGDGGLIVTDDDSLAEELRMLRVHGAAEKYIHHKIGANSRLDAMQAAMLRVKLPHLPRWQSSVQRLAADYDAGLADVPGIETPHVAPNSTHVYHQYTIRVDVNLRDPLRQFLADRGIGTGVYYPCPLHEQAALASLGYEAGSFPEAERASREVLSLPMFPELERSEQDQVISAIREFAGQAALSKVE